MRPTLEGLREAVPESVAYPKRISVMWLQYGTATGKTCGACVHLRTLQYANRYFKCALSTNSGGPGTDWRKKWPACGKFEENK